jgi:RNA polymerase sigma factor (TIGR02999 family)
VGESSQFTELLNGLEDGEESALDRLLPVVYGELRRLAEGYLRHERQGHTLQPTALVHEAYLRLTGQNQPEYQNRAHFCGVAAQVMRQILVDHARKRNAGKRGGGAERVPLIDELNYTDQRAGALVALDDALKALASEDPQKAKLVELRYFGGLTADETAKVTGLEPQAIYRELRVAQAWLQRELDRPQPAG